MRDLRKIFYLKHQGECLKFCNNREKKIYYALYLMNAWNIQNSWINHLKDVAAE